MSRIGRIGDWSGSGSSGNNNNNNSGSGRRFGTLGDLNSGGAGRGSGSGGGRGGGGGGAGRGAGGNSSSDSDSDGEGENWFAGGERSGISVQNPGRRPGADANLPDNEAIRSILEQAQRAGPARDEPQRQRGPFSGGGNTLGSDEVASTYIPDPSSVPESGETQQTAIRHITFWQGGFQVEERDGAGTGTYYAYDDPANAQLLRDINAGRAPPHVLDVMPGQPVELRVAKRTHEQYVPPKEVKAFGGSGQRLGAPVAESSGGTGTSMPGTFEGSAQADEQTGGSETEPERVNVQTRFEVDQSLPTTSVQVRLADGTRLPCRMNLTHTVLDLRNFINAARPENLNRAYTIGTTFPNRVLDDDKATIEDAGLKNSVVVQRWV